MNFAGCADCHKKEAIKITGRLEEELDGEEVVTYQRKAKLAALDQIKRNLSVEKNKKMSLIGHADMNLV